VSDGFFAGEEVAPHHLEIAFVKVAAVLRQQGLFQAVEGFARGENIWKTLSLECRINQLEHMISLVDELYPTFRWFLFDGRQRYASPYTVFGPKRAAIYMGNMFFVFNSTEHIRVLIRHFDDLIRAAVVQPPDVKIDLGKLLTELSGEGSPGGAKEVMR
jgi:hypothetical protein